MKEKDFIETVQWDAVRALLDAHELFQKSHQECPRDHVETYMLNAYLANVAQSMVDLKVSPEAVICGLFGHYTNLKTADVVTKNETVH